MCTKLENGGEGKLLSKKDIYLYVCATLDYVRDQFSRKSGVEIRLI